MIYSLMQDKLLALIFQLHKTSLKAKHKFNFTKLVTFNSHLFLSLKFSDQK